MRLDQAFATGKPTISFEFFPPKTEEAFNALYQTIEDLRPLKPSYVSVTYGAGGSTRSKTLELCGRIQNEIGFNTVAHLTCVGHTRDKIGQILDQLWESGIRNILALRGDPPGGSVWTKTEGGFDHAGDLVGYVKNRHDFFVAVAGFPEGHPQCLNLSRDLEYLKAKVDAGADAIVTQLFFDNNDFLRFRDNCVRLGIDVPIIGGIMPISNVAQIKRFVTMCGAKIPMPLLRKLEKIEKDPDAVYNAGIDYATNQCRDLIFHDVAGLHFYTLNKSKATTEIVKRLNTPHA
ncbi:MAG: methylenetetrahydrofolate reductase [NAD(P)H] [Burkholderiales bacterium]|nr:methylenetetrahydrofolate reductase [NAD(P)H] [Phycisphaerae bacterium]